MTRRTIARLMLVATSLALPALSSATQASPSAPNVVALTMKTPNGGFSRMVVQRHAVRAGERPVRNDRRRHGRHRLDGLRIEASARPSTLRLRAFPGHDGVPLAK